MYVVRVSKSEKGSRLRMWCWCLKVRKVLDCVCGVCVSKSEKGSRLCVWMSVRLKVRKVLECVCGVCV